MAGRDREHRQVGRLRQPQHGVLRSRSRWLSPPWQGNQDVLDFPNTSRVRGGGHKFPGFHRRAEEGGEPHGLVNLPPKTDVLGLQTARLQLMALETSSSGEEVG